MSTITPLNDNHTCHNNCDCRNSKHNPKLTIPTWDWKENPEDHYDKYETWAFGYIRCIGCCNNKMEGCWHIKGNSHRHNLCRECSKNSKLRELCARDCTSK
jgi:hypothetical protein